MSLCGQSPLFVPTTVNAQIRNIDAVTVDADDIFCKTLSINGEAVSTILQNVASSTSGVTVFNGEIQCGSLTASGDITGNDVVCVNLTTSAGIDTTSVTASGSVSGLSGSFTTLDSVTTGGNVSQTAGTASLQATTVTSLTDTGDLTMSGTSAALSQTGTSATASLKATTVTSLTDTGNLTMSGTSAALSQTGTSATASLKATTVTSLTDTGDLTMSGTSAALSQTGTSATASLKATTVTSLAVSGSTCTVNGKNVMVSEAPGASAASSLTFTRGTNFTRIGLFAGTGPITLATSATAYAGGSRTNRGDTTTTWSSGTLQLTSSSVPTSGVTVYGWCDIMRYSSTQFLITATFTENASSFSYSHTTVGIITTTATSFTISASSGTFYMTYF